MSKLSYLRCFLLKHKQLNIILRYLKKKNHTFRPIQTLVKFRYIQISYKRKTNAMFGFSAKTRTTCSSKLTKTKAKQNQKTKGKMKREIVFFFFYCWCKLNILCFIPIYGCRTCCPMPTAFHHHWRWRFHQNKSINKSQSLKSRLELLSYCTIKTLIWTSTHAN